MWFEEEGLDETVEDYGSVALFLIDWGIRMADVWFRVGDGAYTRRANPNACRPLNGQTRISQPKLSEMTQITSVRHVSIVDLPIPSHHISTHHSMTFEKDTAHLAAALTALVTDNPDKLKTAIDTQIAALVPRIFPSPVNCLNPNGALK